MKTKVLLLITIFIDVIGLGIIIPVLPFYVQGFGVSDAVVTVLFAVYALLSFLSAPLLGSLSDRIGRRPVLVISIASSAIGWLVFASAKSVFVLFLGRIIDGLAAGNITSAQSWCALWYRVYRWAGNRRSIVTYQHYSTVLVCGNTGDTERYICILFPSRNTSCKKSRCTAIYQSFYSYSRRTCTTRNAQSICNLVYLWYRAFAPTRKLFSLSSSSFWYECKQHRSSLRRYWDTHTYQPASTSASSMVQARYTTCHRSNNVYCLWCRNDTPSGATDTSSYHRACSYNL